MSDIPICGQCDDGYTFEPPLQDGAQGSVEQCTACIQLAQSFWRNYKEIPQ